MHHTVDPLNTTISAQIVLTILKFRKKDHEFHNDVFQKLQSGNVVRTREAAEALYGLLTSTTKEERRAIEMRHFQGAKISFECPLYNPLRKLAFYFHAHLRKQGSSFVIDAHRQYLSPEYRP